MSALFVFLPLFIFLGLGIYIFAMLKSNKAEIQGTPAERSAALTTAPAPGYAAIFVYRDGFVGKALGIDVVVDDQLFVQLRSPRFAVLHILAGTHTLAVGPKGFAASQVKSSPSSFTALPGETIVFHLEMKMGAIRNTVVATRMLHPSLIFPKLSGITMVVPGRRAVSASPSQSL